MNTVKSFFLRGNTVKSLIAEKATETPTTEFLKKKTATETPTTELGNQGSVYGNKAR